MHCPLRSRSQLAILGRGLVLDSACLRLEFQVHPSVGLARLVGFPARSGGRKWLQYPARAVFPSCLGCFPKSLNPGGSSAL